MSKTKLKGWFIRENIHAKGTAYVVDENAREIAFCQTVADAEKIVRSRESQTEMYEALKDARDYWDTKNAKKSASAWKRIVEAIAHAEGRQ